MHPVKIRHDALERFASLLPLGCYRYHTDRIGNIHSEWDKTAKSPLANLCSLVLKTKSATCIKLAFEDFPFGDVSVEVIDDLTPWPTYTFPAGVSKGIAEAVRKLSDPVALASVKKAEALKLFKRTRGSALYIIRDTESKKAWLVDGRRGVAVDYALEWSFHEDVYDNAGATSATLKCLSCETVEATKPLHKDAKKWIGSEPFRVAVCPTTSGSQFYLAISANRFHVLPDAWSPK